MRIGHGFDIHRLVSGRPLRLAGITVPYEAGLLGHSDGDVVLHAVCDALLGAIAAGDVGRLFPDSDPRFKGIDSTELLREVVRRVHGLGYVVRNLDVTVQAERPRLAEHIESMRTRLAELLVVDSSMVSVKAKTMEGLDAVGRGEAIAATAVVLCKPVTKDE
ncbi:MAG: 2-C-methyl-D-erythritol 2,4-cyclodiphosphate synthase [Deltaproteobacteria bacterium]|nr:2-C-methyl-D-erythritol 2,4-cyclodiphosphate synthase [Deltaproteobacteria bacterium]